jgi:hypothetical protein
LGRNQETYAALFTEYLFTHEVSVYESIKKALLAQYYDATLYYRGFVLLIMKLSEKLCTKIHSLLNGRDSTKESSLLDGSVMESRAAFSKKMVKVQRIICEYCDKLCDLNSNNTAGNGLEALAELKEYLKVFIKEKENQYKIKIHKKLYGANASADPL